MKGLLLAEKPSVMRAVREVYQKEQGLTYQLDFGAFHGHLMELKLPGDYDAAWDDRDNASILPMIPASFSYKVSDKDSVDRLLKKIKSGSYDFLVNACDAGREGEHIFWSFYETLGLTHPVKRLWITSVTKRAIQKGLHDLKDSNLFSGMRQAAKYRAQLDWLVGMNFTRAANIAMRRFVTVGRVQSPTLKLIVDREKEIQAFKPEDFYEVMATFSINGQSCDFTYIVSMKPVETRMSNKSDADAVVTAVQQAGSGNVVGVNEIVHETFAPTLYSITELQKDANKYLKFKADKTLAIAQKLYEDGLLTYPRTESRALPTDMIPELPQHIKPLTAVPELAQYASKVTQADIKTMLTKKYVDDAGVTDHHAIIPTDQMPNMNSLSKDEAAIYTLVGKSFLAIFMPPYKSASSTILVKAGGRVFRAQGTKEVSKGFSVLYPAVSKNVILPSCAKGDVANVVKIAAKKKTTKPPPRLTPRSVLSLMLNAGQDLSDSAMRSVLKETKGIGTPATRSEILKKLEEREYVEVKGNAYYALPKGITLIDAIGDRTFSSALLTAQWEEKLLALEAGKYTGDFRKEMEDYIKEETASLLSSLKPTRTEVGICPICGHAVIQTAKAYICEQRKKDDPNSCRFWLPQTIGGATLSKEAVDALLNGQKTETLSVATKSGKTWKTQFYLDPQTYELKPDRSQSHVSIGACPVCKKPVYSGNANFFCSGNLDKTCTWSVAKTVKGRELKDTDIKALLELKKTRMLTFIWSNGQKGQARLYLNPKDGKLLWEFAS